MNAQVKGAVLERCKVIDRVGECEYCGNWNYIELHHAISGSGKRTQHETEESVWGLCRNCHDYIHGKDGRPMNLELKKKTQKRYKKQGYTEDETRKLMGGKFYL